MRLLAHLTLSAGLVVTLALVAWGFIRMRARLRGKLAERPPLLLKEPDILYRDGRAIAHVEGAMIDDLAKSVYFERLTGTVNLLNLGPDILDFRSYRLRCVAVQSMTGAPPSPYRYEKVTCNIVAQA